LRNLLRPKHVRNRLTLWYLAVLSGVLALYAASALLVLRVSLRGQLDEKLKTEFERVEEALGEGANGLARRAEDPGEAFVEVWWANGGLLYRSPGLGDGLGAPGDSAPRPFVSLNRPDGTRLRVLSRFHRVGVRRALVRVALGEGALRHEWYELAIPLLLGLPLALAIAGLGGHWLAGRALAPLERMARHAERLTADTLGERLPVDNPEDELGHLARVFNTFLGRIEESFAQLRRFTADVSHELRTPLTAIRSVGEVGLTTERSEKEYRDIIGSLLEEADHLTLMIDSLLSLSRADAGGVPLRLETVELGALLSEVASHLGVLAEEKAQSLVVDGGPVSVSADRLVLRQAFVNLLDNAIKHGPEKSQVGIAIGSEGRSAWVDVTDEGPGIHEAFRERVFERFFRIDEGRSRDAGGAGLGLAIARWAVRVHGGDIEIRPQARPGSTFRVTLPAL
jgi:heavy metal sensor kinase